MPERGAGMAKKAFTLIELLVVISIIALLLSILMPALRKARKLVQRTVCLSNVKQQGLGLLMYSQEYNDTMPLSAYYGGNRWLWDVSYFTTDVMIASGGDKKIFRCPGNPIDTMRTEYWRYTEVSLAGANPAAVAAVDATPEPATVYGRQWHFRVVSYFYMMEFYNNPTDKVYGRGQTPGLPNVQWVTKTDQMKNLFATPLVTDCTAKYPNGDWTLPKTPGQWSMGTNHMAELDEPWGSNILYADNHAAWRPFQGETAHPNHEHGDWCTYDDVIMHRYTQDAVKFWW